LKFANAVLRSLKEKEGDTSIFLKNAPLARLCFIFAQVVFELFVHSSA
jgi:hypothetical protein